MAAHTPAGQMNIRVPRARTLILPVNTVSVRSMRVQQGSLHMDMIWRIRSPKFMNQILTSMVAKGTIRSLSFSEHHWMATDASRRGCLGQAQKMLNQGSHYQRCLSLSTQITTNAEHNGLRVLFAMRMPPTFYVQMCLLE